MTHLLLLPGLICDARVFRAQLDAFPQARAINGYGGENTLPGMARRVLEQAPPTFSLLGHSMGARVAMEIFRVAPERIERIALVSAGVHGVKEGEAEKRYALRDLAHREGMAAMVETWLLPMFAPHRRTDEAFVAPLRQMCLDAGVHTFEAHIAALLARPEIESLLPQIRCPALVAAGTADTWSPPAQHAEFVRHIPDARYVTIADAGHMLPAEAPDALNRAIADWLAD